MKELEPRRNYEIDQKQMERDLAEGWKDHPGGPSAIARRIVDRCLDDYGHCANCEGLVEEIAAELGLVEIRAKMHVGAATKRPVAFRLPEHDGWIILQSEDAARIEAEHRGVAYQGLYVRDGN